MPRKLTAAVSGDLVATQATIVDLYDLYLDGSYQYFTTDNVNKTFPNAISGDSVTYLGLGASRKPVTHNIDLQVDNIEIELDNADRGFASLMASGDFRGRRAVIRSVLVNASGDILGGTSGDFVGIFDGQIDNPSITEQKMALQVVSRVGNIRLETPRRKYQLNCPWEFAGTECAAVEVTAAQLFNRTTLVAASGSTATHLIDATFTQGGSGDYWKDGEVTGITGINKDHKSKIRQSTHSGDIYLEFALQNSPAANDRFEVRRGCGKTLDRDCRNKFNNVRNFGGFHTIPKLLVARGQ